MYGDLTVKLDKLHHDLTCWACRVRLDCSNLKNDLSKKLEILLEVDRTDAMLDDLLDT